MDKQKEKSVGELIQLLEQITIYNPELLSKGKELGAIDFRNGLDNFVQSIEMIKEFKMLPFDLLPNQTLNQLKNPILNLANSLKKVDEFTLVGQTNPEEQRNNILQEVQRNFDNAFIALTPYIPYLSLKSSQVQETIKKSNELLKETNNKVDEELHLIEEKRIKIEGMVRAASDAVQKIGVAQFATKFEELSKEHDDISNKWLKATIVIAIITIILAIVLLVLFPPLSDINDPATIQRIITKLIVISILYYAAIWSSRNYRSHRHLSVVNKHRQSALSTFETFVNAAADQDTKMAVLLEATHCIFTPSISGYLGADEENPSNRIIEILKTASGSVAKK